LADQLAIIRRGKILFNGKVDELKDQQLGPAEYVATLSREVDGWNGALPKGVRLSSMGSNFLRFQIENPRDRNPILIAELLRQSLPIVSFQQVPRSLETAYLSALQQVQD